jgi:hypothetical protein
MAHDVLFVGGRGGNVGLVAAISAAEADAQLLLLANFMSRREFRARV